VSYQVVWPSGLPNRGPEPVTIPKYELRLVPGQPRALPESWPASRVVELLKDVKQLQLVGGEKALAAAYAAEQAEAKKRADALATQAAADREKESFLASLEAAPEEEPKSKKAGGKKS